jgi:hypothetical protein
MADSQAPYTLLNEIYLILDDDLRFDVEAGSEQDDRVESLMSLKRRLRQRLDVFEIPN